MKDTVIKVEKLSKKYRLGEKAYYKTAKEEIVKIFSSPFKKPKKLTSEKGSNEYIWALKDVSFEVKKGEVVGIIGKNGAGKTTLLKILSRITEPTEGYAEIHGRVGSLLEVGTGFHPELTGRENIYLNGAILGMKKKEIDKKFDEIVEFSGIEKFIDTPVKRYSSGMFVRLAFSVAAHLEPEILFVDEVLSVGDVAFQKKCLGKMDDVSKEGRTVLFISHNMAAIQRLCGWCLLLDDGKVSDIGETTGIVGRYIASGISDRAEFVQGPDPSRGMRLRRMVLIAEDGKCRSEFAYTENFRIVTEYDVNWPVSGCQVCISVMRSDGVIAFGTSDYDTTPSLFDHRQPGIYRAEVRIPSRWLNGGRYTITAYLSSKNISYDRVETLAFTIIELDSPGSLFAVGWRQGVFQPMLSWHTQAINSASTERK